jgi:signal transduction histidine kinase
MFDRPANGIAGLIALAAIVVSIAWARPYGYELYSLVTTGVGVAMLLIGGWWLSRQAPGTPFRELAIPAAVATVVPFLVSPGLDRIEYLSGLVPWTLAAAAAATLGLIVADSVPQPYRMRVTLLTAALPLVASAIGIFAAPRFAFDGRGSIGVVAIVLLAATTAVPCIIGAVLRQNMSSPSSSAARGRDSVVGALELAVVGITPAISVIATAESGDPRSVFPVLLWIVVVLAAQFFAVRPLARDASVATAQRDQVVAAMEAERSRIAADIHDDALQELTMLGWRLDASGDSQSAATAREVAERLRAILGDLRLPILDDLGTGPALEWLVDRVGKLAGGEVRLERSDVIRPPADVELAFFRVAQEALSNAVRHGRPPIIVRYWTTPSSASLAIDDAGPGIAAAETAGAAAGGSPGHFGLLNMRQRAEQIGALLDIRRWPSGGTRVTLEWRS